MFESLEFHIRGVSPTLMHNGQLADSLNKWAKAIKVVSSKRKKTDEDHEQIAYLEFMGSLYKNHDGKICWPGQNIETMIRDAAKISKEGKLVQQSCISPEDWPLIYDGPSDPEELWAMDKFRSRVNARVAGSTVMRTRPIFFPWELKFVIQYESDILDRDRIVHFVNVAGQRIGLSDWRPRNGRFDVLSVVDKS